MGKWCHLHWERGWCGHQLQDGEEITFALRERKDSKSVLFPKCKWEKGMHGGSVDRDCPSHLPADPSASPQHVQSQQDALLRRKDEAQCRRGDRSNVPNVSPSPPPHVYASGRERGELELVGEGGAVCRGPGAPSRAGTLRPGQPSQE